MIDIDLNTVNELLSEHGYVVHERIGYGQYSVVFRVYSEKYKDFFVAKVYCANNTELSFDTEVNCLTILDHPNIVEIYEYFKGKNYNVLILELCGKSLESIIKKNGPLSKQDFEIYSRQLCDAIKYCHDKKIVHRDIKPSNILLDKHNRIKLADFGFAKQITSSSYRYFCGSLLYMAPELFDKTKRRDPVSADIWSLGVTLYYLLVGDHPYKARNEDDLVGLLSKKEKPSYPENTDLVKVELINKMLSFDPRDRPSIEDIIQALQSSVISTIDKPKNINIAECGRIRSYLQASADSSARNLIPKRKRSLPVYLGPRGFYL